MTSRELHEAFLPHRCPGAQPSSTLLASYLHHGLYSLRRVSCFATLNLIQHPYSTLKQLLDRELAVDPSPGTGRVSRACKYQSAFSDKLHRDLLLRTTSGSHSSDRRLSCSPYFSQKLYTGPDSRGYDTNRCATRLSLIHSGPCLSPPVTLLLDLAGAPLFSPPRV